MSRVDVKFKNISMGEYYMDDIIFNLLSLHDVGRMSELPLLVGTHLDPPKIKLLYVYKTKLNNLTNL